MSNKLYVVQFGYATFGEGATQEEAIADAISNGMERGQSLKNI